jgi:hypothetical protein
MRLLIILFAFQTCGPLRWQHEARAASTRSSHNGVILTGEMISDRILEFKNTKCNWDEPDTGEVGGCRWLAYWDLVCTLAMNKYQKNPTREFSDVIIDDLGCLEY